MENFIIHFLVCQQWKRASEHAWSDVKKLDYNYYNYGLNRWSSIDDSIRRAILRNLNLVPKLINYCGLYLNELDITALASPKIMPRVKYTCPNLIKLRLRFQGITSDEDFKLMTKSKMFALDY